MKKETLRMSQKELKRVRAFEQLQEGAISLNDVAERLRLTYRHVRRLRLRFAREGAAGLVHGSRDRVSNRSLAAELKQKALALYDEHLREYGPTLASEVLEEEHGVLVHPETLRRWLWGACLYESGRRHLRHRKRRERRERFGEMLQIDGSFHAWLGEGSARTCLMVAVDDATGRSMGFMAEEETTDAAYALLGGWIARHGVPESAYVDRRSVYATEREPTAEERAAGSGAVTDFGRACFRLGIRIILARSPEAKGRVERKNGVLQDRLVKFFERRGIRAIASAQAAIPGFFDELDAKHAKAPANPADAHRKAPSAEQLLDICCREERRKVARDWTVQFQGRLYQIVNQGGLPAPAQAVTVRTRLDRSVAILHQGRELAYRLVR